MFLFFPHLLFFVLLDQLIFYVRYIKNLVHLLVEKDNLIVLSDDNAVVVHFQQIFKHF